MGYWLTQDFLKSFYGGKKIWRDTIVYNRGFMSFNCVYCGKEARYIYKGTSLCKDHLDKELVKKERIKEKREIVVINAPEVPE